MFRMRVTVEEFRVLFQSLPERTGRRTERIGKVKAGRGSLVYVPRELETGVR
jgi:hypothetical protein